MHSIDMNFSINRGASNSIIVMKHENLVVSLRILRWDTPIHVDVASGGFIAPFIYQNV